ncbi:PleD family two-component system response regulator [Rickettsiella endosymbiont of Litargus connexus]|uniref:response regulator n=1 Tax=Rickettsiella endosymbiont of Litargus connexus TaxID=3066237 RepID=UPI00376F20DA|nr:response regulator [Gammaproteobacteria bacterium]MCH9754953.1 response regulator [Gammaproteobacteria bacterium]MDD4893063.1 response regulator [Candidatus Rickettsiella isopodorum]MDD5161377.1 response regulator [Candidatus Rickettsiella isopodorum]
MIIKPNPKQILLVDDDELFLKILTQYLDEAQYSYIACKDSQLAHNYLLQDPDKFFVVLSDRVMPKLHGLQLLTQMKRNALEIPLVLFSGEASKEERCEAIAQGVYDFFYKPISKELLFALLKKIKKQLL